MKNHTRDLPIQAHFSPWVMQLLWCRALTFSGRIYKLCAHILCVVLPLSKDALAKKSRGVDRNDGTLME